MAMTGWVLFVFCIGLAVILVGMVGGAFLKGRRRPRRTYWLSWLGGGVVMVVADLISGGDGWTIGIFLAVMSVIIAFLKSPYIKIGNTIIAAKRADRLTDPPDDDEMEASPSKLSADRERR